MIDNLIIIIPTHNRQNYLRRVVKYYSSFPCKVYISDSSKEIAEIECSDNISYRWVPQSNFYGKVLDVLNETSADFYALSPDDDFLKQETLMECYEALKNNSHYSAGLGRQVLFNENFDGSFWSPDYLNRLNNIGKKNFRSKAEYVQYFESHYQNILWSLFRKEVITKAFKSLSECNFSNGNFIELVLGIEAIRNGDIYMSRNGLNYREIISSDHWGSKTLPITWDNISKNNQLSEDVEKFKQHYDDNGFAEFCLNSYLGPDEKPSFYKRVVSRVGRFMVHIIKKSFKKRMFTCNIFETKLAYTDSSMSALIQKVI